MGMVIKFYCYGLLSIVCRQSEPPLNGEHTLVLLVLAKFRPIWRFARHDPPAGRAAAAIGYIQSNILASYKDYRDNQRSFNQT